MSCNKKPPIGNEDAKYDEERWYSHTSALAYGLFFLLVGVPIWWQTTTVYRADLPYTGISQAFHASPTLKVDVEFVIGADVTPVMAAQFGEDLQEAFAKINSVRDYVTIKYRGNVRLALEQEIKRLDSVSSKKDFELFGERSEEKYVFYLMKSASAKSLRLPYINSQRQIFLAMPSDLSKLSQVIEEAKSLCNELFRPSTLSKTFQTVHGAPINDKELLRSMRFDSAYTVVFSLLVPEPEKVMPVWDMSTAVHDYLSGFIGAVSPFVEVKTKSQVLYYETLPIKSRKSKDSSYKYMTPADMPHLINPVEARLGSFVDTNPTLNFIVYVPTESQFPLHLHNEQGEKIDSQGFLVPRWGGFYFYNINSSQAATHEMDMSQVFTELLPQLRALMGFSHPTRDGGSHLSFDEGSSFSQWEVDQWMRQKTVENIGTTTHALYSLSKLVQNIRNMIINDNISERVKDAVEAVQLSHQLLSKGAVTDAFTASRQALNSAERAFFDPSLLELLYFPEDQKFAIYIPLFLPIGIPLLTSTLAAVKWFRRRNKAGGKEKTE